MAVQPAYDLGTIATQRLLRRITSDDEQPVEEIVVPVELIIRSSATAPSA